MAANAEQKSTEPNAMHDIRWIRENPDEFDRGLARRGLSEEEKKTFSSDNLLSIDQRRRAIIRVLEGTQARRNAASKEIGAAKKDKDEATAQKLMAEVAELKESIPRMEREERDASKELDTILSSIPNLPAEDCPEGAGEEDNVEHHRFDEKRNYAFTPKQHFELGKQLGFMDFETAAKLSGARFVVLKSGLARLERALGQFFVDLHTTEHGYTEIAPPLLVKRAGMFGTAQFPKFEDDQFSAENSAVHYLEVLKLNRGSFIQEKRGLEKSLRYERSIEEFNQQQKSTGSPVVALGSSTGGVGNLTNQMRDLDELIRGYDQQIEKTEERISGIPKDIWLIPTAEVPLTNLVRESIVEEAELPLRFTAYTPCFRAEAGAAGKDTRGMIRQHQFNKVELVSITTPEESNNEHERMLSCAEEVLRRLGLHYRVVTLCTGDMGFASQKTYDIEVWLPGQGMYREISSCSNCGDFQARRMDARFRGKENRTPRFVHTLNGSGVAVGRALIAVMETYQQDGGSIAVPDVLQSYMGGRKVIEKG
jgi:seryl-tRNA synthetase